MKDEDGWFDFFNGYFYKITSDKKNWIQSREECLAMDADLVVYGAQSWMMRRFDKINIFLIYVTPGNK